MPLFNKWRKWILFGVFDMLVVFLFGMWIAGNLYYVGTTSLTSFLLTGPEGHVLIDGAYPETPPMIIENISKLGYDITDVKVLLNSHSHPDHAGGLAALQKASGAQLWIRKPDADIVESGGRRNEVAGRRTSLDSRASCSCIIC